jgi:hypothetical protein
VLRTESGRFCAAHVDPGHRVPERERHGGLRPRLAQRSALWTTSRRSSKAFAFANGRPRGLPRPAAASPRGHGDGVRWTKPVVTLDTIRIRSHHSTDTSVFLVHSRGRLRTHRRPTGRPRATRTVSQFAYRAVGRCRCVNASWTSLSGLRQGTAPPVPSRDTTPVAARVCRCRCARRPLTFRTVVRPAGHLRRSAGRLEHGHTTADGGPDQHRLGKPSGIPSASVHPGRHNVCMPGIIRL